MMNDSPSDTERRTEEMGQVLAADQVRLTSQTIRVGNPSATELPQSTIKLEKVDGTVQAIEVTCTCGKKTQLRCVYDTAVSYTHLTLPTILLV